VFQFLLILFMSVNCRLILIFGLLLKFICLWPFFRFEHQIRPEHVLPSADGHDCDDDDFMPFPNTRSSSLIDKSKDVAPRKPRQTRAEVYTIYFPEPCILHTNNQNSNLRLYKSGIRNSRIV
jgi:hypothetical protein